MRRIAPVAITYVGGPTAIVEIGGVRLITDPTFDPPGDHPVGSRVLTKTAAPALAADLVGPIDAVLLSHHQHPDNLDNAGREFLAAAPQVLSTTAARDRLGGSIRALSNWDRIDLPLPDGRRLRVQSAPAQHGPDGSPPVVGEVTAFVVSGDGLPTLYVAGDNASLDVVREIADRIGPIDIALLFAGGARTTLVDGAYLTLTNQRAAEAAVILDAEHPVPVHYEHWAHFTEGADTLQAEFDRVGLADRLHLLKAGERIDL